MKLIPRQIFALLMLTLLMNAGQAASLTGQISLTLDGKPLRATEAATAVVYYRPSATSAPQPAKMPYVMRTERKQFVPQVLPIVAGSQVTFPNVDPILHNAFSTTNGNLFDTGLYGKGEGETVKLSTVGVVRVYCNVHHSMQASILVLNTPHFAQPNASGQFVMTGIPAGKGELFVWHERATLWRKPIEIQVDTHQDITLNLVKRRIPPHLNKFGKPYRRSNDASY